MESACRHSIFGAQMLIPYIEVPTFHMQVPTPLCTDGYTLICRCSHPCVQMPTPLYAGVHTLYADTGYLSVYRYRCSHPVCRCPLPSSCTHPGRLVSRQMEQITKTMRTVQLSNPKTKWREKKAYISFYMFPSSSKE